MKITLFFSFTVLIPWANCPSSFSKVYPTNFPVRAFDQMFVLLGNSRYFMGNCIGFRNFLEFCCQCKVGTRIILAYWSQVGAWPVRVHPWRLRKLHPWWWDRDLWENNVWAWGVHVDLMLKTWRTLPILIFYDIGMFWGNRFGHIWTHFVRYNGRFCHWLLLWRVCSLMQIICHLAKYVWELLNCDHLGVANVGKWRLGFWVLQGMG